MELENFSITVDENQNARALEILTLAEQHRLSAYDAAYLEIALREGLPLATLDENLKKAARTAGVSTAHP